MKQNQKNNFSGILWNIFFISAAVWLRGFFLFWILSMKKTSKAKALQKAPPVKAKKHSLKLTALQKAKAKSSSKKPATSNPGQKKKSLEKDKGLTKENLEKLGSLSLEDKVKAVAETAETEEAAAEALQKAMSKAEKNKAWSKHNTWLNHNPGEKEALQKATKAEKGLASALFLLRKGREKVPFSQKQGDCRRKPPENRRVGNRKRNAAEIQWWRIQETPGQWEGGVEKRPYHMGLLRILWHQKIQKKQSMWAGRSSGRKARNLSPQNKKRQAQVVGGRQWNLAKVSWCCSGLVSDRPDSFCARCLSLHRHTARRRLCCVNRFWLCGCAKSILALEAGPCFL